MTVRVGVVGTGTMARVHLRGLLHLPEAEVVGLHDTAPGRAAETLALARGWAEPGSATPVPRRLAARVYDDLTRLLADVDALYVCVPPFAHGEIELAAAAAGVALFVEKPVALDMATAGRVAAAIERAGIIATSGYQLRHGAGATAARAALAAGATPVVAHGLYLTTLVTQPWWGRLEQSGGQVVEQATHTIDLMRHVLGEVEEVWAAGSPARPAAAPEVDIPGGTAVALRFASGAVGTLTATFLLPSDLSAESRTNAIRVIAPDRVVEIESVSGRVVTPAGSREHPDTMAAACLAIDSAFVRAVATGDASGLRSTYADAAATLAVTLAINESIRTGRPVRPAALGRVESNER